MAGSYDTCTLPFKETVNTVNTVFQSSCTILQSPPAVYRTSNCFTFLPILSMVDLFNLKGLFFKKCSFLYGNLNNHSGEIVMVSHCEFSLHLTNG